MTTPRSTESPMDFEYTSRPSSSLPPSWAPATPRKRSLGESNPPASPFPASPHTPTFGRIQNVPFMLNIPAPHTPHTPAWVPPHELASKAYPHAELHDVDMAEPSPPQPTSRRREDDDPNTETTSREIATGGMRRVFKSRQKQKQTNRLQVARVEDAATDSESDPDDGVLTPITQNTSNHYTLNLPSPVTPHSDTPYVLLGYLQFFFNSSLVLVFLYLLVQFILTVQRDVEHRISEYSMDIVQEIAQCATHYKNNLCQTNAVPAMLHQCGLWETCMNRDPTKVGRARVGAELIAEVVNGFVEPISWKTLAFTLTSLSFLTVFVNSLLSLYRSRHTPAAAPPPAPAFPLTTPLTPYPHHQAPWAHSWPADELPARRRKLEGGVAKDVK